MQGRDRIKCVVAMTYRGNTENNREAHLGALKEEMSVAVVSSKCGRLL